MNEFLTNLLTVAISLVVVIVIYKLVIFIMQKAMEEKNISKANLAGFSFMLKVILGIFFFIMLFAVFGVSFEQLLSASTVGGIIIGFTTTEVMSQIVSGIYLILSGPFGVSDLVKIDDVEGLVLEIGMSYTTVKRFDDTIVQIPNKKILDSKITNYTLKMTDELKERQQNMLDEEKIDIDSIKAGKANLETMEKLNEVMGSLSKFMLEDEITRYMFSIEVDVTILPEVALEKMNAVCENFTKIYTYRPVCMLDKLSYRATVRFRIYCPNPRIIINNMDNFLDEIATALHGEDE